MNATDVNSLQDLLQQAMDSAVIVDSYRDSAIATGAYLKLLASHRQSFDPEQRMLVGRFHPEIGDDTVRKRLRDVIKTTLGEYIHNDMLQSAIIVTGGAMGGFKVSDLMNHLLTIGFCRGAQHAARSFYECAENSHVDMQFITLIDGITVDGEIEISEGIRLVPVPNSASDFPPYVITLSLGHYADYYGRTLLIVDQQVSPVFAHPGQMSVERFPNPFMRTNLNTLFRDFVVAEFCEALSLSANHLVKYVAWWTHVNSDEAYAVGSERRSPAYSTSFHRKNPPIEVSDEDVQKAKTLYNTRRNLRPEIAKGLRVPMDRWMKSKVDAGAVDVFINLGTALESLYLNDAGNAGELRFRMALRAAWHLGNGRADRSSLFDDFRKIYDRRSKAVHTGILSQTEGASEFMARAQELCLKSIVKIIEDGEFPDWDELVMGD